MLPKLKPMIACGIKPSAENKITVLPPSKNEAHEGSGSKKRKSNENNLPADKYKDLCETRFLDVSFDEEEQKNDTTYWVKAQRQGDLGLSYLDIRQIANTEKYQGPTMKGVNIPLEYIYDLKDLLDELINECEEKGIL